jgi:formylglycine-generating enzyme required for sulfatase activity
MNALFPRIALLLVSALLARSLFAQQVFKDCPECPEMVVIPAGSFMMGSPSDPEATGNPSEKPQHGVQIKSFAMGKYEVTQGQWYAVMGNFPIGKKGSMLPVESVSWDDAQRFIAKLNKKTGWEYRLPSEAEWEYAARAQSTTEWSFGDEPYKLGNYAWYNENSRAKTHEVGQKLPNAFGLFDMHGNVWEWTQDC